MPLLDSVDLRNERGQARVGVAPDAVRIDTHRAVEAPSGFWRRLEAAPTNPVPVRPADRQCPFPTEQSSREPAARRTVQAARSRLSFAGRPVPAGMPLRRLREAPAGGLSHPPGDLRPALYRLVDPGE